MDAVLLKIGKRSHIEQLRSGLLYMNTQRYFAECEADDNLRSDPDEGLAFIHQPTVVRSLILSYNNKEADLSPYLTGPFKGGRSENQCNLFCMYSLTEFSSERPIIDPRTVSSEIRTLLSNTVQNFLPEREWALNLPGTTWLGILWNT